MEELVKEAGSLGRLVYVEDRAMATVKAFDQRDELSAPGAAITSTLQYELKLLLRRKRGGVVAPSAPLNEIRFGVHKLLCNRDESIHTKSKLGQGEPLSYFVL